MIHDDIFLLFLPILSGFISLGLAIYTWLRRSMIGANKFVLVMIGASIWCFAHTLKIVSNTTQMMIVFDNIAYIGMDMIAIGVLTFSISYTQNKNQPGKWVWILLSIEPILNLIMIWSDPLHGLFRTHLTTASVDHFNLIIYDHGIWGIIILSYFYTVFIFSLLLLIRFYLQANQLNRTQTAIFILGICFPYTMGILSMLGFIKTLNRDIFPVTFGLSSIFLAWGVFRFRIFDIMPVARERIIESMHEGMVLIDEKERIIDVNPAALEIIGFGEKDILGKPITHVIPLSNSNLLSKNEKIQLEAEIKNVKTDSTNMYEIRLSPLTDQRGEFLGQLIFLQDITRRKILEAELHRMATTDSLTGLLNRRQFETLAKREFFKNRRSKAPLSILMLDIDHFKIINDTYGHAIGDEVLKEFTQRCQQKLRVTDLFARFGGEEFVILLPETDQERAEQVAVRVRDCISRTKMYTPKGPVGVSTSIGVATSQNDKENIEAIIDAADQALYKAKDEGGNTIASAMID